MLGVSVGVFSFFFFLKERKKDIKESILVTKAVPNGRHGEDRLRGR